MPDKPHRIRILIASPSDVQEERKRAIEVIRQWNASQESVFLEAIDWETYAAPEGDGEPQEKINEQIVDRCDCAVGIFWTRIGTATKVAPGGAVEEIQRLEESGRKVMVYFSNLLMSRQAAKDPQFQRVDKYREEREKKSLCWSYGTHDDFEKYLYHHLNIQIPRWFPELFKSKTTVKRPSKTDFSDQQVWQKYCNKLRNELNTISLLGSSVIQPFPLQLKDIFVPLEMYGGSHESEAMKRCMVGPAKENVLTHRPEHVLKETYKKYKTLLVIGDPGSGKTTLTKYYALTCLEENPPVTLGFEGSVRVFYLPLRDLERNKKGYISLPSNLAAWSRRNNLDIKVRTFQEWLDSGISLVLLDGLDEVSDPEQRKEICRWIKQAQGTFDKARFVVTSRPTGYRQDDGITLDFDHQRVAVKDFSHSQQIQFLNNWYRAALLHEIRPEDLSEGEWEAQQSGEAERLATAMIEYFKKPENKGVRELAAVPMLLQIMAILWKERKFLPNRRQDLYSAALDYLLEYRDRVRDREPLLSAEDTRRVLAPVALWMQEVLSFDEADRKAMHEQMQQKLDKLEGNHNARDICRNLVDRTGVLVEHGKKTYMFRHKTFREYLAGVQLKEVWFEPDRIRTLVEHFGEESGWWDEVIKFFMAQSNEKIFDHFMRELFASSASVDFSPKQKKLLAQVIEESPEKRVDALCEALLNEKEISAYRQRSILDSLKSLNQAAALDNLHRFKKDGIALNQDINELAEDVIRSLEKVAGITRDDKKLTKADTATQEKTGEPERLIRNPYEHDAQYILIPGGKYLYSETKREVTVSDLYVAKYPVTNKQYRSFIDFLAGKPSLHDTKLALKTYKESLHDLAGSRDDSLKGFQEYLKEKQKLAGLFRSKYDDDRKFNKDDQPVVGVSWYAARAYCLWLTMLAGDKAEYRLPTEVEWEWAAGGRRDKPDEVLEVRSYPWGDTPEPSSKYANYDATEGATTPVGRYPDGATPEGLYDMAGNVWEWMENWYDDNTKRSKALRGGSWNFLADDLLCSARNIFDPLNRNYSFGFRVVRPSPLA
ncbi:protein of unknown function DUF323 [Prosthecochloris aestuarii DSM 271]|uniref:NACHT domain-containing protein n=1 Tax=Prosthecochloris aestuarii (strain DSM 271 / SK 413) TaxID=290512 RepID=B4S8T5_PROA2|nr:SUMF1/EgtB/PvdO family nonheme iron enzyme [Prosthecochloris aestuarii]ACF46472.1 protein of unknown function DUF323 [Prosthecochloris aestuarii DSM 271]